MYAILGEDESDVSTLKVLVRRLAGNARMRVGTKGYGGCAELLKKGTKQIQLFHALGHERFIVCHDADGPDPSPKRKLVESRIIEPSGIGDRCCVVIPVQELEAWILADIECAPKIFQSWQPKEISSPETIARPKEHLEHLSRDGKPRPRYNHTAHNERMAEHLDLEKVFRKCPSFRILAKFVQG